jgi:hypothetical protein
MANSFMVAGCRKGKDMNFLEQNIEDYISPETNSSDTGIVFECDELDMYDFPDDVNLPEGEYYSMIVGLRNYKDKYKKEYVDVCYKVFNTKLKLLWEKQKIERIWYYYIRQRILRDSDDERRFRFAMECIIGDSKFTDKDLIGVTEYLKIYFDDDPKGAIVRRRESELQDVWFFDDVSDEFHRDLEDETEETA